MPGLDAEYIADIRPPPLAEAHTVTHHMILLPNTGDIALAKLSCIQIVYESLYYCELVGIWVV